MAAHSLARDGLEVQTTASDRAVLRRFRKLVIELDGGQHDGQRDYDERRTADLAAAGWRVRRFWNNEVLANIEGVWQRLVDALEER